MAGNGEASVRIPINLEIVNSSLADIRKVLDSLSPNTKNFNTLKSLVSDMEKSAASFAQKMSIPFTSKNQFASANKDLDKFMAHVDKFNKLSQGISLDNFKIDASAIQQIEALKTELKNAQEEITKIQQQTLEGLMSNETTKAALIKIDIDPTKQSFEEIEEIVNEKVDEINEKISEIGNGKGAQDIEIGKRLKEIVGKDFISANVLGDDIFGKYFKKNGDFKAHQDNPFLNYLEKTFSLTEGQRKQLEGKSAAEMNKILSALNKNGTSLSFFRTQTGKATRAENINAAELQNNQELRAALEQVQNAYATAGANSEQYRQKLAELATTIGKVTQASQVQNAGALNNSYSALAAAVSNYKSSLEQAQGSLLKLQRQQASFNALKTTITNFMGFAQVLNLVRTGVRDAAQHIRELDEVMNGIAIVTDMSTSDLWGQVDAYTQLAQKYGVTIKGAYEVSKIYYQQGLKSNEVMGLTEETLKLAKISGLDYATTTDYMTTALRGFHMEMSEASKVVDVYSNLAANTAVSQQELAEAMTRTASSMEAVGATFEETSAMIATMVAATRESASNIGSAMKSIGSRYGELTKNPQALIDAEGDEMSFNKVDAALKSVGISMQTAEHQFRDFTDVILELSDAWETLDSRQQRYIATQFAGNRQQSRFLALVSNGKELRQNLEVAENSEGTGSLQVEKTLEGLEAKINRVQTAWQEFYTTIGIENIWKNFLDGATQVLNTLNSLPKAFGKIPIVAINAIITIINTIKTVGLTALSGISRTLVNSIAVAGQMAKEEAGHQAELTADEWNTKLKERLTIAQGGIANKLGSAFNAIGGGLNAISLLMDRNTESARKNAATVAKLGAAFQAVGGVAQLVAKNYVGGITSILSAILSIHSAVSLFQDSEEEKLNRLEENTSNLKTQAQQLKSDERSLNSLKKKYDELEEHRYDSEEAAQAFQEIQNEIAEKFPELVDAYDSVGNATIEAADVENYLTQTRIEAASASATAAEAELAYLKAKSEVEKKQLQDRQKTLLSENKQNAKHYYGNMVLDQAGIVNNNTTDYTKFLKTQEWYNFGFSLTDEEWLIQVIAATLQQGIEEGAVKNVDSSSLLSLAGAFTVSQAQNLPENTLSTLTQLYKNSGYSNSWTDYLLFYYDTFENYNNLTNQLLETDYEDENFDTLFENWTNSYNSLRESMTQVQRDLADEIYLNIQQAKAGIKSSQNTQKQLEKQQVQYKLQEVLEKNNLQNLKNSQFYTVLSNNLISGLANKPEQSTTEEYVKQYIDEYKALENWLNSLDTYTKQQLETRLKDRRHYNNYFELINGLDIKDIPSVVQEQINGYYDQETIRTRAKDHISETAMGLDKEHRNGAANSVRKLNGDLIDTEIEEEFNNQLINFIKALSKYNPGEIVDLSGLLTGFTGLENKLKDIIVNNGILSEENIDKSIEELKKSGYENSDIVRGLKLIKQHLASNVLISLQTELDAYTKGADTAISNIKKLQSGVGFEDLSKILSTLNQYLDGTEALTAGDFNFADGKWTIKIGSLNKAITGYTRQMSEADNNFSKDIEAFEQAKKLVETIENGSTTDTELFHKLGINIEDYAHLDKEGKRYIWDSTESKEQLLKAIESQKDTAIEANNLYNAYVNNYANQLLQLANDQKRIDKSLNTIISNRTDLQITDLNKIGEQLNVGDYNKLLDEGFISYIDGHYTASASQLQKFLDKAKSENNLSVETLNNYQAQITKLKQESSIEAALSDIISSPDKVTEDMLTAWANALHVGIDEVKDGFIKNADGKTYTVENVDKLIKAEGMEGTEAANKYYQSLRDATKSVYSAFVNAISTGSDQYLNKTTVNTAIVEELKQQGAEITETYGQYVISGSSMTTEALIKALEYSKLSQEEQTKQIDSLLKAEQSKNFDNIFSAILKNTKNISRDTMQKLADFYGVSVEALLATDAFEFNGQTQAYEVQDKSYLKSILATSVGKISEAAYRSLEAQLYVMENEFNGQAMNFLSNTSLKETDVADILNKFQEATGKSLLVDADGTALSFAEFINTYFTRNAAGNLEIKSNEQFKSLARQLGLTEEQIQNALIQRISNTISNLQSLSNEINSGFNTPDKMNAILQEIRHSYSKDQTGTDFDFKDIFEYNNELNKFVYTQTGIALRIRQLKTQLQSANTANDAVDAQRQLDIFMAELGQSIDITGYLNLEQGTKESQKARQELIRNVNNFNAAALEHTGKIAISQEELSKALSGNLNSIENIYKTINKDISSNDLVAIYQRPMTTIQNALSGLEEGAGAIVDETTYKILEDAGAIKRATHIVAAGKWQINALKSIEELGAVYSTLYDAIASSSQKTTQQLNELAVKIAKNQMSKQQAGLDLMSNATEMTIDQFVDIFTSLGITVDKNFLAADKWGKYLTLLGGDNLQIKDLSSLIKEQGLEEAFSTEKGKEALKSYADSMINQGNSIRDRILQLATDVENAEIGDQINVAGLEVNGNIITGVQTLTETFRNNIWEALIEQYKDYLTEYDIARIRNVNAKAQEKAKYDAAKNITDNWNNISYEMLEAFAKANNYTMESVLKSFTPNADGSYAGKGNKLAFAKAMELDENYIAELQRSSNETVENVINSVFEGAIQFLSEGTESKIIVTDENRDILTKLNGIWGELDNTTNEFIIKNITKNVDQVIATIQATTGISQSQKNQWISQLYKGQQEKAGAAILSTAFSSYDNLDYETIVKLSDKFGQTFTNRNATTGVFSLDLQGLSQYLEGLDKLPNILGIRENALKQLGLDNNSLRTARAEIASLIQSSSIYTRGNALISSRENISETLIADFLNIADISEQELMRYMTKEGDHWKMNDNQALAFAKRIGMTQEEIFKTFATNTANTISNLSSNITSGFSDFSQMQAIVNAIDDATLSFVKPTIDNLFSYNESLGKFVLSTEGIQQYVNLLRRQLDKATTDGQKTLVEGQIKQLQKSIKDAVDFETLFTTGRSTKSREQDKNALIKQLADVVAVDDVAAKIIYKNINDLFKGGEAAVKAAAEIYGALGKTFTTEDANKFHRMNLSQVEAARDALDSGVGDYITQEAATLGVAAGYFTVSAPDSNGFVQILKKNKDKFEQALREYYHSLLANGEQDIDKLNEAIISIWEEQGNKISGQSDLLSKASGMTFREFGEGLAAIGVTLTENMLQDYIDSGLIEQIAGTNQIKVTNFEQFARHIGVTDRTSKQYQDLYSQFIDSQIEDLTYAQEVILSSVDNISGAKAGDKINVSKVMAQFDKGMQLALEQYFNSYGAQYLDGILSINQDTDVFGIANALLQASTEVTSAVNGEKIENAMLELEDAIQDAINGFVDAITNSIKGGVTKKGRSDLIDFAKKYLGEVNLTEKDFTQAANGLKLTTDAAIRLYNALKDIEGVDINGMFDELSESLLNRDGIDTMDEIMAKIKSLSEEITAAKNAETAATKEKIAALEKELSLYQEIAVAGINNPDKYNFMDKKLPDSMQGPLNYWKSTASMMQTMASSAKSGYMSVEQFYAIATEMESLAKLSGETMSFMGMEIGEGAMSAAEVIQAGMSNLSTNVDHAGEINLSGLGKFGLNLSMSAEDMAAGVEKGINAAADANIDMLDGLIAVLETIVAMKGLEDITGDDNTIDLEDIFPKLTVDGKENTGDIREVSGSFKEWVDQLSKDFGKKSDLAKKFENIKLGSKNLKDIITDIHNTGEVNLKDLGLTAEQFTQVMESFRQLNQNGGFDSLDDTAAMMKTLAKTGAEITVNMGDQQVTLTRGKVLIATKNKKGKYEYTLPDGSKTTDVNAAYQAQLQADLEKEINAANAGRDKDLIIQNKDKTYSVKIGKQKYKISINDKGNYVFEGLDGKEYSTIESAYNDLAQQYIKDSGKTGVQQGDKFIKFDDMQTWQIAIALELKVAPKVENAEDLTPEMLGRIVQAGYSAKELEGKEIELGFSIDLSKLSPAQINDIQAAIDNYNKVVLTPEIAPINAKDIEVDGAIHVFAVIDGFIGADGQINLRNSSGGYNVVSGNENLRTAMGLDNDEQKWKDFYRNNEFVRQMYTPSGESYNTPEGRAAGKVLWEKLQQNAKLTPEEELGAKAYAKAFVEPVQQFLESNEYKNALKEGKKQAQAERDKYEAEHGGNSSDYDYTKSEWYKAAFETQKGQTESYVDSYKKFLEQANESSKLDDLEKLATVNGKVNKETYDSLLAAAATAWKKEQSEPLSETAANTAAINANTEAVNAQTNALKEQNEKLQKEKETAEAEKQKLTDEKAALTKENADLTAKNTELQTEIDKIEGQKDKLNQENTDLQAQLNEAEEISKNLTDEKNSLIEQNADLNQLNTQLQLNLDSINAQLDKLTEEKNNLYEQLNESRDNVSNLQESLNAAEQEAVLLNQKLAALETENDGLINENASLKEQMANLSSQLLQTQQDLANIKQQLLEQSIIDNYNKKEQERQQIEEQVNEQTPANWTQEEIHQNDAWLAELRSTYNDLEAAFNASGEGYQKLVDTYSDILQATKTYGEQHEGQDYPGETLKTPEEIRNMRDAANAEIAATLGDLNEAEAVLQSVSGEAAAVIENSTNNLNDVSNAASGNLDSAASAMDDASSAAGTASGVINGLTASMNAVPSKKFVGIDVTVREHNTSPNVSVSSSVNAAKGNVALAKGTRTLMGELGPELVVSNGRYFLTGQNGAEFVDLDKDAIVFNHLQTQSLLTNGHSGRGVPFTNVHNATSMATGNVSGPAKASAEAVLSQLYTLRAMWQSLKDASISDLAKKAGGGGGGGGGNKQIAGFIRDVERWYNWLQKIAELEKEINKQELLRSKIQSDMKPNGKAYYTSQKASYEDLKESASTSQSLALSQRDYFNKRKKQLNNSPLGTLYQFNDSGQLQYQEGTLDWLADVFTTDDYGNQKYSPKQQYNKIIAKNSKFANYMKYDESGKEIKRKDFKSDDEYYQAMVKAFSDRMDSEKEEMQQLFDSWNEQEQAVLEKMQQMNELVQAMKDNQMELENSILDAIIDSRERQIEELQNTRDALEETNEAFIDGLSKSLDKERDMYQNNQDDQELQRNRRQLAILQRSGGSAEQIASLQEKIQQQSQNQYFDKQQEQIDAVKEASDLQIERLDKQIELQQEQLEYEKAHGLLWSQVYEVMSQNPTDIANFITENNSKFWEASPLKSKEDADNILFQATQWTQFRDDEEMQKVASGQINQNLEILLGAFKEIYKDKANWKDIEYLAKSKYDAVFKNDNDDPNKTAYDLYKDANKVAKEKLDKKKKQEKEQKKSTDGGKKSNSGTGRTDKEKTWSYNSTHHYHKKWNGKGSWEPADKAAHSFDSGKKSGKKIIYTCTVCKYQKEEDAPTITFTANELKGGGNTTITDPKTANKASNASNSQASKAAQRTISLYASGGKNDYTGFAILHGTPTEPEGILNAEEYKAWKDNIKTTNLLFNALNSISAAQAGLASSSSYTTNTEGIIIQHAEVNMNTTIANDYDARRAGEQALEQMVSIARKSGTRSVQRR